MRRFRFFCLALSIVGAVVVSCVGSDPDAQPTIINNFGDGQAQNDGSDVDGGGETTNDSGPLADAGGDARVPLGFGRISIVQTNAPTWTVAATFNPPRSNVSCTPTLEPPCVVNECVVVDAGSNNDDAGPQLHAGEISITSTKKDAGPIILNPAANGKYVPANGVGSLLFVSGETITILGAGNPFGFPEFARQIVMPEELVVTPPSSIILANGQTITWSTGGAGFLAMRLTPTSTNLISLTCFPTMASQSITLSATLLTKLPKGPAVLSLTPLSLDNFAVGAYDMELQAASSPREDSVDLQ